MARAGNLQINVSGYGDGNSDSYSLNITSTAYLVTNITLSSGNNTLTIPSGAGWLLITEDAGLTLLMKGASGDTGKSIAEKSLVPWVTGNILNSGDAGTISVIWL